MKGPDRGYVDQSPPTPPSRPPTVIPISKLTEAQRVSEEEQQVTEPLPPKRRIVDVRDITEQNEARRAARREEEGAAFGTPALLALLGMNPPEPETESERASEPTVEVDVPRPKAHERKRPYKARQVVAPETKVKAVREVLMAKHEAEQNGTLSARTGIQSRVADKYGVDQSVMGNWVKSWVERNPKLRWPDDDGKPWPPKAAVNAPEKTVASAAPPAAPNNGSARDFARALLGENERTIESVSRELQAALTQVKILKAELKSMLD